MKEAFLALVRLGIGNAATEKLPDRIDWDEVEALAEKQGMLGILYDAVQELKSSRGSSQEILPPLITWLRWIGEMQLEDERYNHQWYESCKMALLFHQNNIRTYILKGFVLSECYPKPQHRISSDVDCFLLPEEGDEEVWEKGNQLMEEGGFKVERGFYKNSAFYMPGFAVENHRYMVPFRGNKTLMVLKKMLQGMLRDSALKRTKFEGTELWHPSAMVSALFLIEHAYSHFLHEGLTWRHVLDWMMFSRKHK